MDREDAEIGKQWMRIGQEENRKQTIRQEMENCPTEQSADSTEDQQQANSPKVSDPASDATPSGSAGTV